MDRRTGAIYESHTRFWMARRAVDAEARAALTVFAKRLPTRARVADLGCGPGWYAGAPARREVALDLTRGMLRAARRNAPQARPVRGDLARLPFARESLDGAWAKNSYIHLPFRELAGALAELHRVLRPGAPLAMSIFEREGEALRGFAEQRGRGEGALNGRLFTLLTRTLARDLLEGAGFRAIALARDRRLWLTATRATTLADSLRPRLRLLVVGLNPSLLAAATGLPFAGANNRFWPAARAAGWISRERDLAAALRRGVGFTDLAKRATASASSIRPAEYRAGAARVERLVRAFRPRTVVFVGLDGYRRAIDPRARPGPVRGGFAGAPAYLAPSTSGRNAAVSLATLVQHFERARALAR